MQVTDRDWFSQDQLCALSQDPKNRVFTFSVPADPPKTLETQSWSTSQIKNTLLDLRKRFLQLKAAEPELTDDQIRSRLCAEKYIWKAFAREKSLNFQNATDSNTTDEKIKYQLYLLYLKDQLEKGQITEEQSRQMVTTFFLKETANKAKTHVTKQKDKKTRLDPKTSNWMTEKVLFHLVQHFSDIGCPRLVKPRGFWMSLDERRQPFQ